MGLLLGRGTEVILLLVFFGAIQVNAGGYHANTHKRCLIIMALGTLLFLLLLPVYQGNFLLQLISVCTGTITVLLLAPVAHKNHPLSPRKSKQMGKRAKVIAAAVAAIWVACAVLNIAVLLQGIIAVVMAFTFVSLVCARVKKERR